MRESEKSRMTASFWLEQWGQFTALGKIGGGSFWGVGRKGLSSSMSGILGFLSCRVISFPHAPSSAEMVKS